MAAAGDLRGALDLNGAGPAAVAEIGVTDAEARDEDLRRGRGRAARVRADDAGASQRRGARGVRPGCGRVCRGSGAGEREDGVSDGAGGRA